MSGDSEGKRREKFADVFFSPEKIRALGARLKAVHPGFDKAAYEKAALRGLAGLTLKQRMAQVCAAFAPQLPGDFPKAAQILLATLGPPIPDPDLSLGAPDGGESFMVWPLTHYVALHGLGHFEEAMLALHAMTQRFSAEFDIRPFLIHHQQATLGRLMAWTTDPSPHVRRLVSEGSRPRLPWGERLHDFVADPTPTLALLERLKDDPSLYVRRSVANHLNDVAKDHPDRVAALARRWQKGATPQRQWLVRHGLRTLVKQGHPQALETLGFSTTPTVRVSAFLVTPKKVAAGQPVGLRATLKNEGARPQKLVVDYTLHFARPGGRKSARTFKWKTFTLGPHETVKIEKAHPMRDVSIRRHHPGRHGVTLLLNGNPVGHGGFVLLEKNQHLDV